MSPPITASELVDIVRKGDRIYADRYQQQFEAKYPDQFAVIEVSSGAAFVAQFPEEAIAKAQAAVSQGSLHLIRIGAPSAFQLSYFSPENAGLARVL
ncbi:hypothetical protein [Ramlibacter sp.]|uniref:hypothetical protein n=1 Tax=Ramlibacter sp. TaxID=1917967 RepID=UPI002617CC81|nr:hypothetical protein [Ramlibacter sp.]MDB5956730.1 hypothetical protein [Ramlibacter sp.]